MNSSRIIRLLCSLLKCCKQDVLDHHATKRAEAEQSSWVDQTSL